MSSTQQVSKSAQAATSAPTAVTALAAISSPPAGRYAVDCYVYFSGTVTAATDGDNVQLWADSALLFTLLVPGVANLVPVRQSFVVSTVGTNIELVNPGNATASSVYHTMLVANRLI